MVDWEWVDRRRSDGWSWEDIAVDSHAGFSPDGSGVAPGRQLRRLSRERLLHPPEAEGALPSGEPPARLRRWSLARVGWLLFPLFAPWALLAYLLPSPVGVFLPAVPTLGFVAAIAGAILGIGLLRQARKWNDLFRKTATFGAVAGLAVAGAIGAYGIVSGCPTLSPFTTSEPSGFERVPQALWKSQGEPVLFFYGSVACPYCSATSWAVLGALERLGNVSGIGYDHSSSSDVYANTPSVVLPDLVVESPYVSADLRESLNDQQVQAPATVGCEEQAYLSAYNPFGGVPFLVVGGSFVHAGSFVDPQALAGMSGPQVAAQLASHQGAAYEAILPAESALLAYLVWLNHDAPASVAQDPSVAPILAGIH